MNAKTSFAPPPVKRMSGPVIRLHRHRIQDRRVVHARTGDQSGFTFASLMTLAHSSTSW